jgi:hypothetical protein
MTNCLALPAVAGGRDTLGRDRGGKDAISGGVLAAVAAFAGGHEVASGGGTAGGRWPGACEGCFQNCRAMPPLAAFRERGGRLRRRVRLPAAKRRQGTNLPPSRRVLSRGVAQAGGWRRWARRGAALARQCRSLPRSPQRNPLARAPVWPSGRGPAAAARGCRLSRRARRQAAAQRGLVAALPALRVVVPGNAAACRAPPRGSPLQGRLGGCLGVALLLRPVFAACLAGRDARRRLSAAWSRLCRRSGSSCPAMPPLAALSQAEAPCRRLGGCLGVALLLRPLFAACLAWRDDRRPLRAARSRPCRRSGSSCPAMPPLAAVPQAEASRRAPGWPQGAALLLRLVFAACLAWLEGQTVPQRGLLAALRALRLVMPGNAAACAAQPGIITLYARPPTGVANWRWGTQLELGGYRGARNAYPRRPEWPGVRSCPDLCGQGRLPGERRPS